MKQQAKIRNYEIIRGKADDLRFLVGEVFDHPNQESFRTKVQVTSKLVSVDEEKGVAETENTIYTLVKE